MARDRTRVLACRAMPLALPDLLATRKGRLTAFFLLYVTEGIPLGFTATAIGTQMRRRRRQPGGDRRLRRLALPAVGAQVGVGPFVDTFSSDRFGRPRPGSS